MSGVSSSPVLATCETSQVLLAGVPGSFSQGSPVFAQLLIGPSYMRRKAKIRKRRNQKKIPTPKTEVGKKQTNNQVLIP